MFIVHRKERVEEAIDRILYSDTYGKEFVMAAEQMIGSIRVYADVWTEEQFCQTSDQYILSWVVIPSTNETHLALNGYWFRKYVSDAFVSVSDCYIAKVRMSREIEGTGNPTVAFLDDEKRKKSNLRKAVNYFGVIEDDDSADSCLIKTVLNQD